MTRSLRLRYLDWTGQPRVVRCFSLRFPEKSTPVRCTPLLVHHIECSQVYRLILNSVLYQRHCLRGFADHLCLTLFMTGARVVRMGP